MTAHFEMTMCDVLRAQDVQRWNMVKTDRQSLAEHSFNVTMIAMRLCHSLGTDPVLRDQIMWHAMMHDLMEVYTGDIPTTTKLALDEKSNSYLGNVENRLHFTARHLVTPNPMVNSVVKLADMLEAMFHLKRSGIQQWSHTAQVFNSILDRYYAFLLNNRWAKRAAEDVVNESGVGPLEVMSVSTQVRTLSDFYDERP